MNEKALERKLAAIFYADVASYSRLTGDDEEGTHRRLSEYFDIIAASIQNHNGRVVHYAGDAVLADFPTVSEALSCAVAIQRDLESRNTPLPEERQVRFRIGINLGEVIVDRDDIYGDGVNVAARLESLADPGGICISEIVYTAIGNKLPLDYVFMGEQRVKNIANPVRAYQVSLEPESKAAFRPQAPSQRRLGIVAVTLIAIVAVGILLWWLLYAPGPTSQPRTATTVETPPPPVDKPSLVVLPFTNLNNDAERAYFADGLTEDLITDLSKVSDLLVIARHSAFAYKGQAFDIQQIAAELGVRYVLEGSVRYAGDKVRINTQLIDTNGGHHLWAERYDRNYSDIFRLQDEVIGHIVESLAVQLTPAEQEQLARIPTTNLEAYDYYLRAEQDANGGVLTLRSALAHYEKAIALDPKFADAYAGYAWTALDILRFGYDMILARPVAQKQAYEATSRALALAPNITRAYEVLSVLQLLDLEHDQALLSGQKAVDLAPGSADAHLNLGVILAYSGQIDAALAALETALRLNPRPAPSALFHVGFIRFTAGFYEQALDALHQAHAARPGFETPLLYLAAAYALLDQLDRAKTMVDQVLNLTLHNSVTLHRISTEYARAEDLSHYLDALRKAGLPEWPFGYQETPENRFDSDAITAMVFGRTWAGQINQGAPFFQQFDADGNVVYRSERSFIIGTATVEQDQLCLRFEANIGGRKDCGYVYRNPEGTAEQQNEYVYVSATGLRYFSVIP